LRKLQDSAADVQNTRWRNKFVDTLVENDVREWATKMVKAFSEWLEDPEWLPMETLVHPVHRVSSRFICTRCSKSGPKVTTLTFREAAIHVCLVSKEGNKDQWSPENFIVDVKASTAITRFATALGIDVRQNTTADLAAISRDIMCLSCSGPIVMGFDIMVQHSHRHDDMHFMILADEDLVEFSDYAVLPGVTAKLMQVNERAKEWRDTVSVGCKHCVQNPLAARDPEPGSGKVSKLKPKPKAFKFDGVRSHLKEKHKVMEVADEDFFVFSDHLKELGYED